MAGLPLPLGSESQKIHERFCVIFEDCIDNNMSKAEILSYVRDKYLIPLYDTNRVWNHLERTNPDLFIAYNAKIRERKAQPLWNSSNVQRYAAASPQEANAVHPSPAGPSRAANAIENQNVQTSLRQPVIPNDFCQQVLNALGQIQSTTEQMLKLLTDGHGLGPHPSATGSLKRKRVGEINEERGENKEGEKLQENERGGNEEAERQIIEKEVGNDEEAEKPQEIDENNDELQKEEGDSKGLQKNERGDN